MTRTASAPPRIGTRERLLAAAEEAVVAKGFDATSIEELAAAVGITRAGFFYHFPDKTALAKALIDRHMEAERALFDQLHGRACELSDDPLQQLLILFRLYADFLQAMPDGYPGCILASATYQDRLFDASVRAACCEAVLGWRGRFRPLLEKLCQTHPPREPVDLDALADYLNTVIEGGIILSRALAQPHAIVGQILLARQHLKLLFTP